MKSNQLQRKGCASYYSTQTWFYKKGKVIFVPVPYYRSARGAVVSARELERALKVRAILMPNARYYSKEEPRS